MNGAEVWYPIEKEISVKGISEGSVVFRRREVRWYFGEGEDAGSAMIRWLGSVVAAVRETEDLVTQGFKPRRFQPGFGDR
ncbi:hypothetical protein U1Q18_025405, partial [Sarracenia purpurea var. burkii]